jgi:hypothetical protein
VNRRPTRHSRRDIKRAVDILAAGLLFLCCSSMADSFAEPTSSPDLLVSRSRSSFSLTELSVDLGQSRAVKFRTCSDSDGCSACKTSRRKLSTEEVHVLSRLAREAKLFGGRANGLQIDLAFRWLEVHAGSDIAILVMTVNDSFSEPGPRKKLFVKLKALEDEMAASSERRSQ